MKAVLIAYACRPGAGSEAGSGWAFVRAAADVAEVILYTTPASKGAIDAAIAAEKLQIDARYIDIPWLFSGVRLIPVPAVLTLRYLSWQLVVAREIRKTERTGQISVVHHVTFASDSLPSALLASKAPVRIWGPVGGAAPFMPGLLRYFSRRGRLSEILRWLAGGALRHTCGSWVASHATLSVALNDEVRRELEKKTASVVVCSNIGLDVAELARARKGGPVVHREGLWNAVFAGRLLEWKGILLAVDALAFAPDWRLMIVGDGPAETTARRRAQQRGVIDRVEFVGRLGRDKLLRLFIDADAMLFPSFHDSAAWAPAEASAFGCPVVCLDIAGPQLQAGSNAHVVAAKPTGTLPLRLAGALRGISGRGVADDHLSRDRLPSLLGQWYGGDLLNEGDGIAAK